MPEDCCCSPQTSKDRKSAKILCGTNLYYAGKYKKKIQHSYVQLNLLFGLLFKWK